MSFEPRVFVFLHARFEPKYACVDVSARRCNLMHCVGLINCTEQFEQFQPASGIVSQVTGWRVQGWVGGFCGNLCFDLGVIKFASSIPMQPSLTLTMERKMEFLKPYQYTCKVSKLAFDDVAPTSEITLLSDVK